MKKTIAIFVVLILLVPAEALYAQRFGRSRGSVSGSTRRAGISRSGNTTAWQGRGGFASGSRTVSQTGEGASASRQAQTQSGASREVTRSVDQDDREIDRTSTVTSAQGETATRERTTSGEGGYASFEGEASTSTGREAEGQGVAGRSVYGTPAVAGSVNTKYYGSYAGAARRNPYGGYTSAAVGPYGGRVTTTLPSGYRTTVYHGRSYYTYGGAYYRPYTYRGVPYYYPVPPPYYVYYDDPPIGAMIVVVAGITYLMSQDGSYAQKTTTSDGKEAYQSVPAPAGAQINVLPAERVLVTVADTTYYLYGNAFYRRVAQGAQEQFVVVTAPAGVVFVDSLPADFEVVQLNTMYFLAGGDYYVPYMSSDGEEMYVLVDTPPQPTGGAPPAAQPAPTPQSAQPVPQTPAGEQPAAAPAEATTPAPAVRQVAQTFSVPAGTLLMVRLQDDVSSATAIPGNRIQGFLAYDLAADGRLIAAKGARVYGTVAAAAASAGTLSVTLTDIQVGSQVVAIRTEPLEVRGDPAVIEAQTFQSFTVAAPIEIHTMTNVAVR